MQSYLEVEKSVEVINEVYHAWRRGSDPEPPKGPGTTMDSNPRVQYRGPCAMIAGAVQVRNTHGRV